MPSTRERIQTAADHASPSVVAIGPGAGVVIEDGMVLTNAHNLTGREPAVRFADGSERRATVRGVDIDGDLAVLEVDTDDAPKLAWGRAPELGEAVTVVAPTPTGPRVTLGYVAAVDQSFRGPRGRPVTGAVEHTAPLARGSSGTPVLDGDGRLVGINTHRRRHGFYLAVPATDTLRAAIGELTRGQDRARPRLGIAVAPPHVARRLRAAVGLDDRPGLLVREVAPDGPAERAGLRRGDLIVTAAGRDITDTDELFAALDELDGATLSLRVVRGQEEREVAVPLDGGTRDEGSA